MTQRDPVHTLDPTGGTPGQVPTINAAGDAVEYADPSGSGSGVVETIVPGTGIAVDSTDPANPVVSATGGGGGGGAGVVLLAEKILAAASASVSFSGTDIPATGYRHLRLIIEGRTSAAATSDIIQVACNSDTTAANYRANGVYNTGGTTAAGLNNTTLRFFGYLAGGSASAGAPGVIDAMFHNYASTAWWTTFLATIWVPGDPIYEAAAGAWKNTAALTSIALTSYGGGNFAIGTKAQLYGVV